MKRDALIFLYGVFCWWLATAMAGSSPTLLTARCQPEQYPNRALLDALSFVESSNNPRAVSPAGARGLYQFMPDTWGDMMDEPFTQAFEPVSSEIAAIRYLEWIRATLVKWKGSADVEDVLACWHGGIGRYRRLGYDLARMPERTQEFVARVVAQMRIHDN